MSLNETGQTLVSLSGSIMKGEVVSHDFSTDFAGETPVIKLVVSIDIKPGADDNSINLGSNGSIPVAIISSNTFNATTVDPMTVTLADATVKLKGKGTPIVSTEDVNSDGVLDLIVHILTEALQLSDGDTEAVLEAETVDGTLIRGTDAIRIVPQAAPEFSEPVPGETNLLSAFPSPSNPETWVPYQLASPGKVTIRIYNMSGHLVRTLDLGQKPAGFYNTKSKAAYWDGRNTVGEKISSGVYFYQFQAGEYSATRKLMITR